MVGTFVVLAWLVRTSAAVADVSLATPLPRSVHRRRVHRRSRCVGRGRVDLDRHVDYVPGTKTFGPPGPIGVRFKLNFLEGGGFVPAMTFVPWVFIPVAPEQALRAGPLLFLAWELPLHFELEVNAGVLFSEEPKPAEVLVLASALTYTIVGNFSVFVDAYATGWDVALGTGALLAITRDAQIDLGTYVGLSGEEPAATPFLGFSIRR